MKKGLNILLIFLLYVTTDACRASADIENVDKLPQYLEINVENDIVYKYLSENDYSGKDYSYSSVGLYCNSETDYRKDCPKMLNINWPNLSIRRSNAHVIRREVSISDQSGNCFVDTLSLDRSFYTVQNLEPGLTYKVDVDNIYDDGYHHTLASYEILVTGQLRMLQIDGEKTGNFRDLGGWRTIDGGTVKYGRLIRGGEVFRGDKYTIQISGPGVHQLIDGLGVDVELDFGDFSDTSCLPDYNVEFIHGKEYQITSYTKGMETLEGREQYHNCLSVVIDRLKEGRVIYFHCNAGADRTGTFAFIIESLCGLSESDLAKDYELTSFSQFGERTRNSDEFKGMVTFIMDSFQGATLSEKVRNMAVTPIEDGGLGLQQDDLSSLLSEMVEYK